MSYQEKFDKVVNDALSPLMKPKFIKGLIHLLLALYVVRLAPELPSAVLKVFENAYFKLFVFSLVLWTAQFSPSISIMIALAFMVSLNFAMNKPLWEFLENTELPAAQAAAQTYAQSMTGAAEQPIQMVQT